MALAYRSISQQIQGRYFDVREMCAAGGGAIVEAMRVGMASGVQSVLIDTSNIFVVR